jgi:hypothetical protein
LLSRLGHMPASSSDSQSTGLIHGASRRVKTYLGRVLGDSLVIDPYSVQCAVKALKNSRIGDCYDSYSCLTLAAEMDAPP